jgi:hypothetical protein
LINPYEINIVLLIIQLLIANYIEVKKKQGNMNVKRRKNDNILPTNKA